MLSPLEQAIGQRARDFDLPALLSLLQARFPERELRFRSYPSLALRPSIVESVEFSGDTVVVTLNLGLFSSSSPLPSYFLELFASAGAGAPLTRLVELLDHHLLRERAESLRPERSPRLFPNQKKIREDLLRLGRPASPAALHRIVAHIFPELSIHVGRSPLRRLMPIEEPRVGYAALGSAALGGTAEVPIAGFDVVIRTWETATWNGEPWAPIARRRIAEHLLPRLAGTGAYLRVLLVDFDGEGRLLLRREGALGFEPLKRAQTPQVIVLFDGPAPSMPHKNKS